MGHNSEIVSFVMFETRKSVIRNKICQVPQNLEFRTTYVEYWMFHAETHNRCYKYEHVFLLFKMLENGNGVILNMN